MKKCRYCRNIYDDKVDVCPSCGSRIFVQPNEEREEQQLLKKEEEHQLQTNIIEPKQLSKTSNYLKYIIIGVVLLMMIAIIPSLFKSNETTQIYSSVTSEEKLDAKGIYEEGVKLCENKEYEKAIKAFSQIPEDNKYYKKAKDYFDEAIKEYKSDILTTAQQYVDKEDYFTALNILKTGIDVLPEEEELKTVYSDYDNKYKKIIKKQTIEQAESEKNNGDYAAAIQTLKKGLNSLPSDAELQSLLSSYEEENTNIIRNQFIEKAKDEQKREDYIAAIKTIKEGLKSISSDSELSDLLLKYEEEYCEIILSNAENAYKEYDKESIDEAIRIIEEGIKIISNSSRLKDAKSNYESKLPVIVTLEPVQDCGALACHFEDSFDNLGEYITAEGNKYNNAYRLKETEWYDIDGYFSGYNNVAESYVKTDYKYSVLTGTIIRDKEIKESEIKIGFKIRGATLGNEDNKDTLYSGELTKDNDLMSFKIDIKKYNELILWSYDNIEGYSAYLIVGDLYLWP